MMRVFAAKLSAGGVPLNSQAEPAGRDGSCLAPCVWAETLSVGQSIGWFEAAALRVFPVPRALCRCAPSAPQPPQALIPRGLRMLSPLEPS